MTMDKRIAVVTGANRGIGYETCRQLARRGVEVILTSRDAQKGRAAAQVLRSEGLAVTSFPLDVTDRAGIQHLHDHVVTAFGRCDILINNAAVYIDDCHSLLAMDEAVFRVSMETNAFAPLWLTQVFVPLMKKNGYGRIVNVSSGIAELSSLGSSWPAYRLSKILLNLQTRLIAGELSGANILINAACPGWVRTDMGGAGAPRSVEQGADTIVWLALLPDDGPRGGFFRDRRPISW